MYGNKSIKHKAEDSKSKDFYYYGCKHCPMVHGYKCDFKGQNNKELLVGVVAEVIVKLVSNPRFVAMMQERWVRSPSSRRSQPMRSCFDRVIP